MSRELIELIVAGDFVCANELFEEQLDILREQKLYEEKKRMAAEKPFVQNTKADWAKYRKQNPSVKWNQNKEGKKVVEKPKLTPFGKGGKLSAADIAARRKAGYLKAGEAIPAKQFVDAVITHLKKKKGIEESFDFAAKQAEIERLQKNEPRAPSEPDPSAMLKSSPKKAKTSDQAAANRDAFNAAKNRIRSNDAEAHANKRMQKLTNYMAKRAARNLIRGGGKGGRIQAAKNLIKYGSQSSLAKGVGRAGKKVGGALSDIGSNLEE